MELDNTILEQIKTTVISILPSLQTKQKEKDWSNSLSQLCLYLKGEQEWNSDLQCWFNRANTVGSIGQGCFSFEETKEFQKDQKSKDSLCEIINNWINAQGETSKVDLTTTGTPFKNISKNSHPALLHRIAYALFPDSFCNTITDRSMEELLRLLNVKEEIDELCKQEGYKKDSLWYGRSLILRKYLNEIQEEDFSWSLYERLEKEETYKKLDEAVKGGIKAFILYGAPGTGKTFMAKEFIKKNNYISKTIQFHPNYSYEDFMGGISPKLDETSNDVKYTYKEGVFMQLCKEATEDDKKTYCLLIDEINRADLSSVFGELLLALEYRDQAVTLGNSGNEFKIPENVIIIGTMNNVDKSLVNFDLALRRRFCFIKVEPNLFSLEDILKDKYDIDIISQYIDRCQELNDNIVNKFKLGKDYQIGQAYFKYVSNYETGKSKACVSKEALTKTWEHHIEPLLVDEYLGTLAEDEEIKKKITELKKNFIRKIN